MQIKIPYTPRKLQRNAHSRKERFALLVCHRRFGKTVFAINEVIHVCNQPLNPSFVLLICFT